MNPTIFNLDAALHAKITQSEYFKCLYVFKTFDKVVDLIYEKVTFIEPFTHDAAPPPKVAPEAAVVGLLFVTETLPSAADGGPG